MNSAGHKTRLLFLVDVPGSRALPGRLLSEDFLDNEHVPDGLLVCLPDRDVLVVLPPVEAHHSFLRLSNIRQQLTQ